MASPLSTREVFDPEMQFANVGLRLTEMAARAPQSLAIATPTGSHRQRTCRAYLQTSMGDLESRATTLAAGFQDLGIGPGKRIGLLVRFGEDFITLVFALLKCGATLVLVDPGMGRKNVLRCLSESQPDGFVAIPLAHAILSVKRSLFPRARLNVTVGKRYGVLPSPTLSDLEKRFRPSDFQAPQTRIHDPAAIIFTTGSTGPPKGVLYTHQTFLSQIDMIASHYGIEPGGRDLSGFPLFGLFNAVMGTATILPDMDPTRPADVDPVRLLDAVEQWEVNQSFGSPALWTRVGRYCTETGRRMESMKRVLSAGAPVPPRVLERIRAAMHPEGVMYTPYGATEALPIASIESRVVLEETAQRTREGAGTCVGNRFDRIRWKVIEINDGPIPHLRDARELPRGQIGELMVAGPVVTTEYVTRTDQNALHKVHDDGTDGDGATVWHRMGDVGYLDALDRFWFCGRKGHRVVTSAGPIFTEPIEAVVNTHPAIYRSALVPVGDAPQQRPCIVVEPWSEHRKDVAAKTERYLQEWKSLLASRFPGLACDEFYVYPKRLPTDIRHNSKIFREQLREWVRRKG